MPWSSPWSRCSGSPACRSRRCGRWVWTRRARRAGTAFISSKGATNFGHAGWRGFDIRDALAERLGLPVIYNNDGNAAALYAHNVRFGAESGLRSSVAAIVGTGLGGGIIQTGQVVKGAAGMAGELGHVPIPLDGLLGDGQPMPACNCGQSGDAESVASLTGIQNNLLPYWLTRYEGHPLGEMPIGVAAKQVRTYGEDGDEMALAIFRQQAMALGRLFTIAANFLDPDAYFLGGGVVEAAPHFRDWFFAEVRAYTVLREEQARVAEISLVPDLDMAGRPGVGLRRPRLVHRPGPPGQARHGVIPGRYAGVGGMTTTMVSRTGVSGCAGCSGEACCWPRPGSCC